MALPTSAVAVNHTRDYDIPQMVMLHQYILNLNSTHNIQEILRRSACKISEIMEGDGCHILFSRKNDDTLQLETVIHYGEKPLPPDVDEIRGISGTTFESNNIIIVTDAVHDPRVTKAMQQHFGHNSMVSAPIIVKGRTIGVVLVYSKQLHKYNHVDGQFLLMMADQLGLALDNAKLMSELQKAAITDPLTEAYNYRYFKSELQNSLSQAEEPTSLVLLDLNDFKQINDTYGHLVGDCILQEVTKILKDSVRTRDSVTRNGGDEFALILPGADSIEALQIMKRIEKALADHQFIYTGQMVEVSISWGATTVYYGELGSIDNVINLADKKLYNMKKHRKFLTRRFR